MVHFGMVVVGLPYSFQGQSRLDEVPAVRSVERRRRHGRR
jgi:hypothetical protein